MPQSERPHRLLFLLTAGHMAGAQGSRTFIEAHAHEVERIVLEIHLEHAASEVVESDGELIPSGEPEPRWWFTSRIPSLEAAVAEALEAEQLDRSLILPPDAIGAHLTTDGWAFDRAGVPLVNYSAAPFYLFDSMDTIDKIHVPSSVPVTRAAVRLIDSTTGISAGAMRSMVVH